MLGRLLALMYLLKEAKGASAKLKLLWSLAVSGRKRCAQVLIPFRRFRLHFRTRQGELTPYREIASIIPVITRGISPKEHWIVIDAGANIGLFSLFLADRCERIIAIEPNPVVNGVLQQNLLENGVKGTAVQRAVSDRTGTVKMTFGVKASVLSSISADGTSEVPSTTVDAIISEFNLPRVDLLKLDLEGHELIALAGCQQAFQRGLIRRIYVEYYGDDKLRAMDSILSEAGFVRSETFPFNALYTIPEA